MAIIWGLIESPRGRLIDQSPASAGATALLVAPSTLPDDKPVPCSRRLLPHARNSGGQHEGSQSVIAACLSSISLPFARYLFFGPTAMLASPRTTVLSLFSCRRRRDTNSHQQHFEFLCLPVDLGLCGVAVVASCPPSAVPVTPSIWSLALPRSTG